MKIRFVILFAAISVFFVLAAAVSADRDGNAVWCNIDKYGCYNLNEDGSKTYINFWSEEARKYFMGDSTAPYTNVVDYCYDCIDRKMGGGGGPEEAAARIRAMLRSLTTRSTGKDSHGKYHGETVNNFYDDGSLDIIQDWNYDDGGHLDVHVTVTGYEDDDGEAWVEGSETYTAPDGTSSTKTY